MTKRLRQDNSTAAHLALGENVLLYPDGDHGRALQPDGEDLAVLQRAVELEHHALAVGLIVNVLGAHRHVPGQASPCHIAASAGRCSRTLLLRKVSQTDGQKFNQAPSQSTKTQAGI